MWNTWNEFFWNNSKNIDVLDGVPVPERAKAATRQMIIYNF